MDGLRIDLSRVRKPVSELAHPKARTLRWGTKRVKKGTLGLNLTRFGRVMVENWTFHGFSTTSSGQAEPQVAEKTLAKPICLATEL